MLRFPQPDVPPWRRAGDVPLPHTALPSASPRTKTGPRPRRRAQVRTRARIARIGQRPSLRLQPNAIGFNQMDRADKPQRRVSHPEPQPVLNNMRLKHIVGAQLGPCPRRKARREQRYPGDGLAAGPPGLELIFRAEQVSEMIKMQMADGDQVKRGEIDVFLQLGKAPVPPYRAISFCLPPRSKNRSKRRPPPGRWRYFHIRSYACAASPFIYPRR